MNITDLELARLAELAVEHLTDTLTAEESSEYQQLRARHPDFDPTEVERAAAALQLAAMTSPDPLPERLRIRLATEAAGFFGPSTPLQAMTRAVPPSSVPTSGPKRVRHRGWWIAAASVAVALLVWIDRPPSPQVAQVKSPASPSAAAPIASPPSPENLPATSTSAATIAQQPRTSTNGPDATDAASAREQFLAANRFVLHRAWRAGNDPAGRLVAGDVVWDPRNQRGFMRFTGLRRNNPNVEQYQLWIFDARRDERYPVDGGVFDITHDGAEVIVIKAALKVDVPLMFAITIERPGGVVVSDRSRIAALANSG